MNNYTFLCAGIFVGFVVGFIVADIVVKNLLREIAKREPSRTIAEFVLRMDSDTGNDYDEGDVI